MALLTCQSYVLGPTDPLTIEAAAIGRAAFAANGARSYLDQLEIALANGPHNVAAKSTSARSTRDTKVPTT